MRRLLLGLAVASGRDVVHVRQRARDVADRLGFDHQDQTRIATAVSEIARNAYEYARNPRVEFWVEDGESRQLLQILVLDDGPGIPNVQQILSGSFRSTSGLGLGIAGAQRLMDRFAIETSGAGSTVRLGKLLPRSAPPLSEAVLRTLADSLAERDAVDPMVELRRQNRELLAGLATLQEREAELESTNHELRKASDALRSSLGEKDVLLREVHHRVKNNLQIITSLLNMQMAQATDPRIRDELRSIWNRIRSLSIIHDKLYQAPDVSRIDVGDYLRELCRQLESFYANDTTRVTVDLDLQPVEVPIDVAINIGLIVNEIVTNSFKHAFVGRDSGHLVVRLGKASDGMLRLEVSDDGPGLPAASDGLPQYLGFRVIRALVGHLKGEFTVGGTAGAQTVVTLPLPAGAGAAVESGPSAPRRDGPPAQGTT